MKVLSQPYAPATFIPQEKILVPFSVIGWINPMDIVRQEIC